MEYNIVPSEDRQKITIKGKPEVIIIVFLSIWGSACMTPLFSFPFIAYDSLYSIGTKTLSCERNTSKKVVCKQTSGHLLGYAKSEDTTWQNVSKAYFHFVTNKKGRDEQWITLTTNDKEITIFSDRMSPYLNIESVELASWVEKFNKFVVSGDGKIELTYSASQQWQVILLPLLLLLFPIVGLFITYFLLQWHCLTFDRDEKYLIWEVQTIFGRKKYQFLLMDIREIILTKTRGSKGGILYYLKIYISGKKSPIPLVFISITIAQNIAQSLGRFLRINVQDLTDR
ncbi:hypothetical protein PseudUWO311_01510 [Pseudanabaena sp. UWO311]|uniref:hypothetical protein n=1 Tax=Pseudanabaena sp. UWO311 TaxID=2487337 RepID=UPI001159AA64|nr:hypothetical protein [Pseudanabaena sp. UWO311]TYQ29603.1 hypothetical protein PseudUWO311_01510 [Pseudanabaena sp. UWO311]